MKEGQREFLPTDENVIRAIVREEVDKVLQQRLAEDVGIKTVELAFETEQARRTRVVKVTWAEVAAARALIKISGGEENVDPVIVRLANAEGAGSFKVE
jgi:hypothetical protein